MANPAVTNTFTNGSEADANAVNQNFTDLISAMTDGTKTFNISALTLGGTLTANGNVVLGASSSNTVIVSGTIINTVNINGTASFSWGGYTFSKNTNGFVMSGALKLNSLATLTAQSVSSVTIDNSSSGTSFPIVTSVSSQTTPLAIVRGTVGLSNTMIAGEGWTSSINTGVGYNVTFNTAFNAAPIIVVSPMPNPTVWAGVSTATSAGFTVAVYYYEFSNGSLEGAIAGANTQFSFICAGVRY